MPLYYEGFKHYFEFIETIASRRGLQTQQQQRDQVVNRFLIGQQAGLDSTPDVTPTFNRTTTQSNRTRGYAEMAAEVVVTETSLTDSASLNPVT